MTKTPRITNTAIFHFEHLFINFKEFFKLLFLLHAYHIILSCEKSFGFYVTKHQRDTRKNIALNFHSFNV